MAGGPLPGLSRRRFLRGSGALAACILGRHVLWTPAARAAAGADAFGALLAPDANGLRLPAGFRSRVVATSGERVAGTDHLWHGAPDGGATFAAPEGGWVYVSNAELSSGGASALRFDAAGEIVDAYSILTGTSLNCAGGPTPWGTWLSCEEVAAGRVHECDPFRPSQGVVRPALGTFMHEAAAVDPVRRRIYLTEDRGDGLLYRFTPEAWPDLDAGALEAAEVLDPRGEGPIRPGQSRPLAWHPVPDPGAAEGTPTRRQAPRATPFDGGEGCWYRDGLLHFTTKGDSRVWRLDAAAQTLSIAYDRASRRGAALSDGDNVVASAAGDLYVAEDPGDLQIVALTRAGGVVPVVQLDGAWFTELTGPAFSPDGTRLYFSSQRFPGRTYEVRGPFAPAAASSSAPIR